MTSESVSLVFTKSALEGICPYISMEDVADLFHSWFLGRELFFHFCKWTSQITVIKNCNKLYYVTVIISFFVYISLWYETFPEIKLRQTQGSSMYQHAYNNETKRLVIILYRHAYNNEIKAEFRSSEMLFAAYMIWRRDIHCTVDWMGMKRVDTHKWLSLAP